MDDDKVAFFYSVLLDERERKNKGNKILAE